MRAENQNLIFTQGQLIEMKLRLAVIVVVESLLFHPAQQPPFGMQHPAPHPAVNRIAELFFQVDVQIRLRAFE